MAQRADGAVVWHRALTSIFWELTPFCRAFDDVPEGQPGAAGGVWPSAGGWEGLHLQSHKINGYHSSFLQERSQMLDLPDTG